MEPHRTSIRVRPEAAGAPSRSRREARAAGGRVALVGAGPGDPELLTLRAVQRLREADIVLVDALVDPRVLSLCRADARVQDVGKIFGGRQTPQADILARMADEAFAGHFVVRLKGGDPFVFGRGGEELVYLRERGIPCEVVPGLSSALCVPALHGIPVTHRGVATHFSVLTGTTAELCDDDLERSWHQAARAGGTLIFLMVVHKLERLVACLLDAGLEPTTPAVLVERGTQSGERVLESELGSLATRARAGSFASPAVVVVGACAALRNPASLAAALPAPRTSPFDVQPFSHPSEVIHVSL